MNRDRLRGALLASPALLVACAHGLGVDDPYPKKTTAVATVGAGGTDGARKDGGSGAGGVRTTEGAGGTVGTSSGTADAAGGASNSDTSDAARPETGALDSSPVDAGPASAIDSGRDVVTGVETGIDAGASSDAAVGSPLPLSTCGRWIVDKNQRRVKIAGVNWYGASDVRNVASGLDKAPLAQIVSTIKGLGFNTVRLPFSNEMLHVSTGVPSTRIAANMSLSGKKPIEVYDAVIQALTSAELFVVLDNNSTHSMACCAYDQDALWFTSDYSEASWIADWEMLAQRYASNLRVIGADLREEPRPYQADLLTTYYVNWGQGGTFDWAAAAKRAGDRILAKNPNLIVFVEGIDAADNLTGVRSHPISLQLPNKLSYEAQQYATFPPFPGDTSTSYSQMSAADLKAVSQTQWGYILDPAQKFTAPVLLGEFGAATQTAWLTSLEAYVRELDLDFAFFAVNATTTAGDAEPFALLENDWTTVKRGARLTALQGLQKPVRGPGINPADTCQPK
jgi:aryl-phospho-beta-D-glucosidase BglC (GH1 family)